jgi:hypothetical protein
MATQQHTRKYSPRGMTILDRLDLYTDKTNDCWLWTSAKTTRGYGHVRVGGRMMPAHRIAYELAYGRIPSGLQVDHKCHTRSCVKLEHLRLVTNKQNQENRAGARANSKSGVRGVSWHAASQKWQALVMHNGQLFYLGLYATVAGAEAVAQAKRLELFTHNDTDR